MPRDLVDAYGTPLNVSNLSGSSDSGFDFDGLMDEGSPPSDESGLEHRVSSVPALSISGRRKSHREPSSPATIMRQSFQKRDRSVTEVRFGMTEEHNSPRQPKVIRIWHSDNLFKEVSSKDLSRITSFKSVKVDSSTTADQVQTIMATKLRLEQPDEFRLYTVRDQAKRPMRSEVLVLPIAMEEGVKIALLVAEANEEDEETQIDTIVGINGYSAPDSGLDLYNDSSTLTHRRLVQYEKYAGILDLIFLLHGERIYSSRGIVECRFPQLMKCPLFKKRKEKKGVLTLSVKEDPAIIKDSFLRFLNYLYAGAIDFSQCSVRVILHTLYLAIALQLVRLIWLCEHYLYTTLGMHNIFEMLRYSTDLRLASVRAFCFVYAHAHWDQITINKKGLAVLGLELFQELTLSMATKEEIDTRYLRMTAPSDTYLSDIENLLLTMPHAEGVAELTDGATLKFHRALLAAYDKGLMELFLHQKEQKVWKFPVDGSSFASFLHHVYYGKDTEPSATDAAFFLEEMMCKYPLERYRELCEESLHTSLTLETALRFLELTYLSWNKTRPRLLDLREKCLAFIATNMAEVDIPSIRKMDHEIAFDLLETMQESSNDFQTSAQLAASPRKKDQLRL